MKQKLKEAEIKDAEDLKKLKVQEEELLKQEEEFKRKEEELKKKEKVILQFFNQINQKSK